jgi:hypothetical protein
VVPEGYVFIFTREICDNCNSIHVLFVVMLQRFYVFVMMDVLRIQKHVNNRDIQVSANDFSI